MLKMLSLGRDEVQCVTRWLDTSSQIMLSFICKQLRGYMNELEPKFEDLCGYTADDDNAKILKWAHKNGYEWNVHTYMRAVRAGATSVVEYIEKCNPEFYNDPVLDNIKIIYRELAQVDLTKYPVGGTYLTFRDLFRGTLVLELVLRHKKLCYIFGCPNEELNEAVAQRISEHFPVIHAKATGAHLVFLPERIQDVRTIRMTASSNHESSALLAEYEYKGDRSGVCYSVRFVTQHGDILYSYNCPIDKYTDDILKGEQARAESFNEVLSPLGFTVSVEVV